MIRLIKNILNMSEAKKTMSKIAGNAQLSTEDKLLMDKLPKRSRKKVSWPGVVSALSRYGRIRVKSARVNSASMGAQVWGKGG